MHHGGRCPKSNDIEDMRSVCVSFGSDGVTIVSKIGFLDLALLSAGASSSAAETVVGNHMCCYKA